MKKTLIFISFFFLIFTCAQAKEEKRDEEQYRIGLKIISLHEKIGMTGLSIPIHIVGELDAEHEELSRLRNIVYSWQKEKDKDLPVEKKEIDIYIKSVSKLPILKIKTLSKRRAIVRVGVVKGPTNASGKTFFLIKKDSKWIAIDFNSWVS